MCLVWMQTHAGGGCQCKVECDNGKRQYNNWQVCEVGKQQFWTDDRIGDFSIEYSSAGDDSKGITRDGLHHPILRFKSIDNWAPMKVEDNAKPKDSDGVQVCYYGEDGKTLWWGCGIPKLGKHFGDNLESNVPKGEKGYGAGECGMHVVQHQKPDPSKDPYSLEVWIKDADEDDIATPSIYPAVKMTDKPLKVSSSPILDLGSPPLVVSHFRW